MRNPGAGYISFLLANQRAIMGHLYQFVSLSGLNDYFTDMDVDIPYGGNAYKSGSLRIEGLRRKIQVGFSVDSQDVRIYALPTDTLWGAAFLSGVESGLLDGAQVIRTRVVWPLVTGNAAHDVLGTPIGVWPMFTGYIAEVKGGGVTHVEVTVKSALMKLDVGMPRNYYQQGCLWALYDTGCTLLQSSFTQTGTVISPSDNILIYPSGGVPTPNGADSLPQYYLGKLQFTSGVNAGLLVTIATNSTTYLQLAYALETAPAVGNTFSFWPGCSKSFNTCNVKFSNDQNYRGFDRVPPIHLSL
jgi:uncharacterized phage protein (TIGR02218 family)